MHRLVGDRDGRGAGRGGRRRRARSEAALEADDADLVVLGCTIIAACVTQHTRDTGEYRDVPVVNPNLLALKSAEMLADL